MIGSTAVRLAAVLAGAARRLRHRRRGVGEPTAPSTPRRCRAARRDTRPRPTTTSRSPRCSAQNGRFKDAIAPMQRGHQARSRLGLSVDASSRSGWRAPISPTEAVGGRAEGGAARARRGPAAPHAGRALPRASGSSPRPKPSSSRSSRSPRVARTRTSPSPAALSSRRRTTRPAPSCSASSTGSRELAQAHYLLGRLAIETESWDEAIARLTRAVELDPDHDGAWTALGYVYESQKQHRRGHRGLPAAPSGPTPTTRPSSSGWATCSSGSAASRRRRPRSRRSPRLAPRDPRVWMKLGAVYYEQKHVGPGQRRPSAACVLLEPSNLRARYFLATTLHGRGQGRRGAGRARADPRAPIRARSTPASSSASCTAGPSATTRPSRVLREAINIEPKRPELFLYLGTALLPGQAVRPGRRRRCRKGSASTTSSKDLHFQLGVVYEKQQRFDDAVRRSAA